MANDSQGGNTSVQQGNDVGAIIIRLVMAAIILAITAFFTPGFAISGIGPLIVAAIVLTIMDYLIGLVLNIHASPFGRGIVGFITAVIILYVTQFFVSGYTVTVWGAIIGAIVYGVVAYLIPGRQEM